jgi:diaminopimelate decarboxylase
MVTENLMATPAIQSILSHNYPLLPTEEILHFIQHYFSRKDLYLHAVADKTPPLYVLESSVLRTKAEQFKTAFADKFPATAFYFAVKSNNHPDVSRILLRSGYGLDVSSGLELQSALDLNARDIVFSGPGKTMAELLLAVTHTDHVVVLVDSFGELQRLASVASSMKKTIRIGVRLTTNPTGLWRKFGILPAKLADFMEKARQCSYVKFQGLQFHTSWNLSPTAQVQFIKKLGMTLRDLSPSYLHEIQFIDIGGGYWPPQGEWLRAEETPTGRLRNALGLEKDTNSAPCRLPAISIDGFAVQLSKAIKQHLLSVVACRICFEPGRWICNDAMHLLMSVVDKKAEDLVVTDAGTNAIGWERFESDYFPVLNLTRPSLIERPCDILGSLCTPHDVWGYSYWGDAIQPGDILMIPTQGAYTYSLRQNFIKPLPDVTIL